MLTWPLRLNLKKRSGIFLSVVNVIESLPSSVNNCLLFHAIVIFIRPLNHMWIVFEEIHFRYSKRFLYSNAFLIIYWSMKSLRHNDAVIYQKFFDHWFSQWLCPWQAPSHYLHFWRQILNWTLQDILLWHSNQATKLFFQEKHLKMSFVHFV